MQKTITIFIISSFGLFFSTDVLSQQATDEQVYNLLEIMDTEAQFLTGLEMTLKMQEQAGQTAMLPEGFQTEFLKEAKSSFKTELLPKMMAVYQSNLSADEVQKLSTFYKSEIGKLLLEKMPTIQSEAANAGMIWGQQLGMKVAQKLSNEK